MQRTGLRPGATGAAKFGKTFAVGGAGRHAPPLTLLLGERGLSMRTQCPHCGTAIFLDLEDEGILLPDINSEGKGFEILANLCPSCGGVIVVQRYGEIIRKSSWWEMERVEDERVIYPLNTKRAVPPEVPEPYRKDFEEASAVLGISPKASAALSRRILQAILHQEFGISKGSLAQEIEEFLSRKDVPSSLAQAIDAIRNVGNFAAHPIKDNQTGAIVEVEPGEADWLLDVLELMFDYAFVQPARIAQMREKLNAKLQAAGKPLMKGDNLT